VAKEELAEDRVESSVWRQAAEMNQEDEQRGGNMEEVQGSAWPRTKLTGKFVGLINLVFMRLARKVVVRQLQREYSRKLQGILRSVDRQQMYSTYAHFEKLFCEAISVLLLSLGCAGRFGLRTARFRKRGLA
jgi:hypothetical protein